uniref:Clathrin heavy chain, putative n=1 Tax=Arundo donax TaxID=35708 RepID=A0A0A9GAG8_ARUDO
MRATMPLLILCLSSHSSINGHDHWVATVHCTWLETFCSQVPELLILKRLINGLTF